jgi:predicted nucleic acid-binding protein
MKVAFVDTQFWIASINPSDAWHGSALEVETTLPPSNLVTTEAVLFEVLNHFSGFGSQMRLKAAQVVDRIFRRTDYTGRLQHFALRNMVNPDSQFQRAYVPESAQAKSVSFDEDMMHVALTDGRCISVPIIWFPLLREATPEQRAQYEVGVAEHHCTG